MLPHCPRAWAARWIGRNLIQCNYSNPVFPAPLYRKAFVLDGTVRQAALHVCGLGYFVARLNGQRVGDHVLDPAVSQYDKRVLYVTHDVTGLLRPGLNAVGMVLGNGWYNCHTEGFWGLEKAPWRDYPKLILELEAELESGAIVRLISDGTWRVAEGPVRFDGLRNGETYDARAEIPGWDLPGFDDQAWEKAIVVPGPGGQLEPQTAPPCRVTQTLTPVSVKKLASGAAVYNLGQNMAGWAQLRVSGPAGTEVVLRYAEKLNRLQSCTRWSYRGNFVGIPTDCPHREKNGWTGDAHLAAEVGLWNFDGQAAYGEWLDSIVDCQRPNGVDAKVKV